MGDFIHWRNAGGRRFIRRSTIPDYFDETFADAVRQWKLWRTFGLPHGGGWLAERDEVLQAITIVDEERAYYEHREAENRRKKHGDS